jgi:NhaC family Na+:H+ antiporter
MTIIAMAFGGIMQETHQFEVIVNSLKRFAKTPARLVTMTEITCIGSNIVMPEQYISIVVPGGMYAEEYKKRGLSATTLSNALESGGTVTSALIPWNTCGVFITTTLGLTAAEYGIWAVFNWLTPIIGIVFAFIGWNIARADDEQKNTLLDNVVEDVVEDVAAHHHQKLD